MERRLSPVAATPFDLSPPPIDHDLAESMVGTGAKVSDDGVVESYDNDDEALDAADNGLASVEKTVSRFFKIRPQQILNALMKERVVTQFL